MLQDWIPSETDANAGFGHYGSCCFELDIWEANEISTVTDLFSSCQNCVKTIAILIRSISRCIEASHQAHCQVYTPHPCDTVGQQRCEGTPCGDNKSGER